jgi:hypothetical protein
MKRTQSPGLCDSDGDERPAKVRRRESLSTPPGTLKREQEERIKAQQPPLPFSPDSDSGVSCDYSLTALKTDRILESQFGSSSNGFDLPHECDHRTYRRNISVDTRAIEDRRA